MPVVKAHQLTLWLCAMTLQSIVISFFKGIEGLWQCTLQQFQKSIGMFTLPKSLNLLNGMIVQSKN